MSTSNLQRAHAVVHFLLKNGVSEVVMCAGARNAPLVELLNTALDDLPSPDLRCWSFFEERSAGFFALGRSVRREKPIAVLTTSGTAVANLLPACIEAYYQGRPLVLITADRPARFRGSGSPQSIDQRGVFGPHTEAALDLEDNLEALLTLSWSRLKPLHLNICFEEPQSQKSSSTEVEVVMQELRKVVGPQDHPRRTPPAAQISVLEKASHPLIIVGPVRSEERPMVLQWLAALPGPIYAEALSGLTGEPVLQDRLLFSEDVAAAALHGLWNKLSFCDSVIRLGSVPTCRLWRDLEGAKAHVPVVNILSEHTSWTGLARQERVYNVGLDSLKPAPLPTIFDPRAMALLELSKNVSTEFHKLVADFPRSEMSMVQSLSMKAVDVRHPQRIYLGNSLAVREWDAVSAGRTYVDVFGHRGVNGIDGQVSSFLAWSTGVHDAHGSLAVLGDLTALYDLAGLALTPQLGSGRRTIAVINNGGGMIFQKIFSREIFLNRHDTSFAPWAEMFQWSYLKAQKLDEIRVASLGENLLLELKPDPNETTAFQKRWSELWQRQVGL